MAISVEAISGMEGGRVSGMGTGHRMAMAYHDCAGDDDFVEPDSHLQLSEVWWV